jgi:hypothetical protein
VSTQRLGTLHALQRRGDRLRALEMLGGLKPPRVDGARFVYHEALRCERAEAAYRAERVPAISQRLVATEGDTMRRDDGQLVFARNVGCREFVADRVVRRSYVAVAHHPSRSFLSMPGCVAFANRGSVCGMELSPDGRHLAVLEWSRGAHVVLLDTATGARRFLAAFANAYVGFEQPLWSPDGRWLLVNTGSHASIVSVGDGTTAPVPFPGAQLDWWPSEGPSTLLALHGTPGEQRLGRLDLARWALDDLGPVELPRQDGLPPFRRHLGTPRVSPDGREVLVGSCFGPPADYQERQGSRPRVALIVVDQRRVEPVTAPFADRAQLVEREHRSWKWLADTRSTSGPTVVHEPILASLRRGGDDLTATEGGSSPRREVVMAWQW